MASSNVRVLVVDDNIDAAETLTILLQFSGFQAQAAHDGRSALDTFASWQPDAVILDINMPGLDGYEVAKVMRKSAARRSTVLVALTARTAAEDVRRAERVGFDVFLPKPVAGDDLVLALRSTLAKAASG